MGGSRTAGRGLAGPSPPGKQVGETEGFPSYSSLGWFFDIRASFGKGPRGVGLQLAGSVLGARKTLRGPSVFSPGVFSGGNPNKGKPFDQESFKGIPMSGPRKKPGAGFPKTSLRITLAHVWGAGQSKQAWAGSWAQSESRGHLAPCQCSNPFGFLGNKGAMILPPKRGASPKPP
ncbi:hypothetical protein GWK47_009116 [Chionoecetes opilio]|uniref:Uncharacterized protein n=1 Tax=Chionoecetes opilio TaxID=41210 RepID=A0A8J5CNB3_CHIOP|nr:hypothetical protein GWK47_009116 [Chionoecetes opilio]